LSKPYYSVNPLRLLDLGGESDAFLKNEKGKAYNEYLAPQLINKNRAPHENYF